MSQLVNGCGKSLQGVIARPLLPSGYCAGQSYGTENLVGLGWDMQIKKVLSQIKIHCTKIPKSQ